MRTACSLGSLLPIQEVLKYTRRLARTDVDTIWIPETWGMENFAILGTASQLATTPRIGSSIINIYSRSPAAIAMGAATVDTLSGGRLVLGLGTSSPAIVEGLHGSRFDRPLQRTREAVEIIRLAVSGKKINYQGRIFALKGFRLLIKPVRAKIPIYLAAVNRKMVDLACEIGDGVIFYLRPIDEMRQTISAVRQNTRQTFEVACQLVTCVSDDQTAAMERARRTISFYIAVGKIYRDFLARNGFEEETRLIYEEFQMTGLSHLHRLVSDKMVRSLAVAGTPHDCLSRLAEFRNAGLDLPILQFNPTGGGDSFEMFVETFFGDAR